MKQAKFKIKGLGIVLLILCIFVTVDALPQQSAEELFEAAVYKKDADGDLEGAIKIFSNILSQFPENKQIAAKAQLNIGLCYEKLGRQNATEASQRGVTVSTTQYQNGLIGFNTVITNLQSLVRQQDLYSSAQGSVATNLVQVYKALGGGWEIRNNRDPVDLLPATMKDEMRERTTDWEGVLK